MRLFCIVLLLCFGSRDASSQEVKSIEMELDSTSFFTDMVVTGVVKFPEIVSEPEEIPESEISIVNLEVSESTVSDTESIGSISFIPRKAGLVTIPSFEFLSEKTAYRTKSLQILVSAPTMSEAMSFTMIPAKKSVYAGEPLRIDVTWTADLVTNQIRSLQCFPELFSRQDAKIVIPRCTEPEDAQIGLPFGGRRITVKREIPKNADGKPTAKFGTVSFPVFVKFEEPGLIELPVTRLEIAHLKGVGGALAPYAVFFNNGLFEPRTSLESFDRYYIKAPADTIEVLPLPVEGQTENFSGLFAPCAVSASIKETEFEVGEVIEIDLRVRSKAPHGMLNLPELGVQRSLRGRFRVGTGYGRTWYEDGTGFLGRIRALTTDVMALPSFQFQIFDPVSGNYIIQQTEAIPLAIRPRNGLHFFDIRDPAPETTLTNQPEGVWQNAEPETMRDLLNNIISIFAEHFWLWLLLGPVAFGCLLPWVKERHRRAINGVYKSQAEAFEYFRKIPEQTEAKWEAFCSFLATSFSMPRSAWTPGDTADRLRAIGVAKDDIDQVLSTHKKMDATDFSAQKPHSDLPELNDLARRLFDHFRKVTPVIFVTLFLVPMAGLASDWEDAEVLFAKAIDSPSGKPATESLFTQSALKFEAAAASKIRPGASWFNAGNSWFKGGEIGRAISCYRQARIYRPFDKSVSDSYIAARALCVDVVEDTGGLPIDSIPVRWLSAGLVLTNWFFLAALLLHFRYRNKFSLAGGIVALVALISLSTITFIAADRSEMQGVVVVGSIYGRKGPAYSYQRAFNEPLHDGLGFQIEEERDNWLLVSLADERKCWIPADQVRRIRNSRL